MSEAKKAIGLRLPNDVWEGLKQYGLEHYQTGGSKSSEGFDVTQTVVTLLRQSLGISDNSQSPNTQTNIALDERITEIIKQQLDDLLSPMLYDSVNDDSTGVSKLLNSKITAIVNESITNVSTELETYTQQQCDAVRSEVKKQLTIAK